MKIPLANTLSRLDRHWLLNHPVLWVLRLHWMIYFWLIGLVLISLIATVLPVSLPSVNFLRGYFTAAVVLTGLALSPWVYLQTRSAPQLRRDSRGGTAVYLLAGYLFIFGIHVAWPYVFTRIIETRISSKVPEGEFRSDVQTFEDIRDEGIYPVKEKFRELALKYRDISPSEDNKAGDIYFSLYHTLAYISAIKDIGGIDQAYYDNWIIAPQVVVLLALLLLSLQVAGIKNLVTTLFLVVSVCIGFILYPNSHGTDGALFDGLISLFLAGVYTTFRAPSIKAKKFVVGLNIFTLLLAWMPCTPLLFSDDFGLDSLYIKLFSLGVVILLVVTPWIERRYLALQANPS